MEGHTTKKPGRRPFGTVRERGGSFQGRYQDATGREHVATFDTRREAGDWLHKEKTDRNRGAWIDPRKGRVTLTTYAERWLTHRPNLRPRTVDLYRGLLDRHILPVLGQTELARLSSSTVRSWHAGLSARAGQGPPPLPSPTASFGRSWERQRTMS